MELISFFGSYFIWHYTQAIEDFIGISRNFIWFLYNFFSIPVLLKTFFSPWKRLNEAYRKVFNIEEFLSSLVVNVLMRGVGIFIRAITLLLGLASLILAFVLCTVILLGWLVLPAIVILLFYQGITEFFL